MNIHWYDIALFLTVFGPLAYVFIILTPGFLRGQRDDYEWWTEYKWWQVKNPGRDK